MDPPKIYERQQFQHGELEYFHHEVGEGPQVLADELDVDGKRYGHHVCAFQSQWRGMWISDPSHKEG